ncbi:OVARIAN TUMOR DOMAIN-containing deubiquitinating enzyme 4 [Sesamum angolense]|uniref:Ubiquitin thioesterase OTU n=1 Tax=Sesamum angolense TaxID=2727404 RepID=A0AAE1X267_9LAMI|nr:OVARIAN TUMOR DOMAIN-containing deubiquitinating enzyme 4 [Sesamum angolense]
MPSELHQEFGGSENNRETDSGDARSTLRASQALVADFTLSVLRPRLRGGSIRPANQELSPTTSGSEQTLSARCGGGAASIWHTILPSHWRRRRTAVGRRGARVVKGGCSRWRCLFRAVAHMACLRNGEEAPDENRQRELADELRAQVVEELLKRRKEVEWFIEEDFDVYVKRIQEPYVWGGEPELLMSSHVLRTPIAVFMKERSNGSLMNIANYGEEYRKDEDNPINVLFHGYGHYDILETLATC